ncbi:hypothetical protein N9L24_00535 [Candidatus Marinamargulisbacteria bacterium]|nr:hypothetical protein [Candidatus Marinamargulisbacteria bacterium]
MTPTHPNNQQLIKNRAAFQHNARLLWPYWVELQQQLSCHIESHVQNLAFRSWTEVSHPYGSDPLRIDPTGMLSPAPHTWSMQYGLYYAGQFHGPRMADSVQAHQANTHQTLWQYDGVTLRQSIATLPELSPGAPCGGSVVNITVKNDRSSPVQLVVILSPMHPDGLGSLKSICYLSTNTVMINNAPQLILHQKPTAIACFSQDEVSVPTALANWDMVTQTHCSHGFASACFSYPVDTDHHIVYTLPHGIRPATKLPLADIQSQRFSDVKHTLNQVWSPVKQSVLSIQTPDSALDYTLSTGIHYLLQGHVSANPAPTPLGRWILGRVYTQLGTHTHTESLIHSVMKTNWWWHPSPDAAAIAVDLAHHTATYTQDTAWVQDRWAKLNKPIAHWVKQLYHHPPIPYPLLALEPNHPHNRTSTPLMNHAWLIHAVRTLGKLSNTMGLTNHMDYPAVARMLQTYLKESIAFIFDRRPENPYLALDKTPTVHGRLLDALYSLVPLDVFSIYDPLVTETLNIIEQTFGHDGLVINTGPYDGFSVRHNAQLAHLYLARGDHQKAKRIIQWLIESANTSGAFPTTVHPSTQKGADGLGHDPVATAACLSVLMTLIAHADATTLNLFFYTPDCIWEGSHYTNIHTPFGQLNCQIIPGMDTPYTLKLTPQFHTPPSAIVIQLHPAIQRVMADTTLPILDHHRIRIPATTQHIQCYRS